MNLIFLKRYVLHVDGSRTDLTNIDKYLFVFGEMLVSFF